MWRSFAKKPIILNKINAPLVLAYLNKSNLLKKNF